MMKDARGRIYLRRLTTDDASDAYLGWLNDRETIQFLEIRYKAYTKEGLKEYIKQVNCDNANFLFGIFLKKDGRHIGNIKIGSIDYTHRFADIGLLIGDKKLWGKGYGSEAIALATAYAFQELNLNKIIAGIYENNLGSYKAFLKAGYKECARLKRHRFYKGSYVDELMVEKLNEGKK